MKNSKSIRSGRSILPKEFREHMMEWTGWNLGLSSVHFEKMHLCQSMFTMPLRGWQLLYFRKYLLPEAEQWWIFRISQMESGIVRSFQGSNCYRFIILTKNRLYFPIFFVKTSIVLCYYFSYNCICEF